MASDLNIVHSLEVLEDLEGKSEERGREKLLSVTDERSLPTEANMKENGYQKEGYEKRLSLESKR